MANSKFIGKIILQITMYIYKSYKNYYIERQIGVKGRNRRKQLEQIL